MTGHMKAEGFLMTGGKLRKRAAFLAADGTTALNRDEWLRLADEAADSGDWLLAEYAYKRGLGLRVLW